MLCYVVLYKDKGFGHKASLTICPFYNYHTDAGHTGTARIATMRKYKYMLSSLHSLFTETEREGGEREREIERERERDRERERETERGGGGV